MDTEGTGKLVAMKTTPALPHVMAAPAVPANATILSLDSPADVARSADCLGPVYWLSTRPPARVVGALAGNFEGAWLEEDRLVVQTPGRRSEFPISAALVPHAASLLLPALAAHLRAEPAAWQTNPASAA